RMLLSQQAQLVRLDDHRAVVQVAGNWMGMVQSRATLLEQAIAKALGNSRQLVLESQSGSATPIPSPQKTGAAPTTNTSASTAEPSPQQQVQSRSTGAYPPDPAASAAITDQQNPLEEDSPTTQPTSSLEPIDSKAKRLADFFNGKVLDVEL
ncbi:MAG: DNA polymerase III subunit gamma/tau, partial [Cyanobacteriota bacterium]|nr:DNA polymerase III subunit gamma/tau [Cyanobacteriota bacterium]